MSRLFPRLDTYVAPGEIARSKPAASGGSPAALEATLADISAEMTEDAVARRRADGGKQAAPSTGQ